MGFIKLFLLVLSTLLPKVLLIQDCLPMLHFDSEQKCLCSPRISSDGIGGWEMNCFMDERFDLAFIIDYAVDRHISVKCASVTSPYTTAMFSGFNISEINSFQFHYCLVPSTPFSDILEGKNVYSLTFESWKNVTNLTREHFENLDDLKVLTLKGNGLSNLPHNLFANLTMLQDLRLNDNNLQIIGESIFNGLPNLSSLEMGSNLIQELPENVFSQLYNLKYLYLYNNKLASLPELIFQPLRSLATLDLSRNLLQEIPSTLLKDISSLTKISLKANRIREIPPELFSSTHSLTELDLSKNPQLQSLPEYLFSGLSKLKSIDLGYCNLSSIPSNLFSPLKNLQTLNLCHNRITELQPDLFKTNINMNVLQLDFNFLDNLPGNLLEHQYSLTELGIVGNKLRELPKGIFKNLVKLKTLRLGHNGLTSLDWDLFDSLQNLEVLDLSNNKLQRISKFILGSSLRHVDLSNNLLTSVPEIEGTLHLEIQDINLEYNNIKFLDVPVVLSNAATISLGWNNISRVDIGKITSTYKANRLADSLSLKRVITRSPRFHLLPNPIQCDCQISSFVSYITDKGDLYSDQVALAVFPFANDLRCSQPPSLMGRKLISLSSSELLCPVMEDCPSSCSCYKAAQGGKLVVNCSYRSLEDIPATAPRNANVLDVSGNKLRNLDVLNNRIWENLTEIYLHDNSLSGFGAWNFKQNLIYISLGRNHFSRLSKKFMNYVSSSSELKVSLGHNHWICSCSVADMKGWLIENFQKVSDVSNIYCVDKARSDDNVSVISATKELLCPPDVWQHKHQLIVICSLVVVIPFLVFTILILHYKSRRSPKAIISGQPCFLRAEQWLWRKFRTIIEHRRKSMKEEPSQVGLNPKGTNPDLLRFVEETISSLSRVPNSRLQDNLVEIAKENSRRPITENNVATIECTLSPKYVPVQRVI